MVHVGSYRLCLQPRLSRVAFLVGFLRVDDGLDFCMSILGVPKIDSLALFQAEQTEQIDRANQLSSLGLFFDCQISSYLLLF